MYEIILSYFLKYDLAYLKTNEVYCWIKICHLDLILKVQNCL